MRLERLWHSAPRMATVVGAVARSVPEVSLIHRSRADVDAQLQPGAAETQPVLMASPYSQRSGP